MKTTIIILINLTLLLIAGPIFADNSLFQEEFLLPGKIVGIGTHFEIKDSEYLNITLKSTEEIKIVLESIPRLISLDISSSTDAVSTDLTISGLKPNKTYYKYQDSYKNETVFISDENGSHSWTQDLIEPHHIWIQEINGTTYIDKDTVLDQDIIGSVEITADDIILDCNGYQIIGPGVYGIYLIYRNGIIIKNCNISNFSYGIYLSNSHNNVLIGNTTTNNYIGIYLTGIGWSGSNYNNLIKNVSSFNSEIGIFLLCSMYNNLENNIASANTSATSRGIAISYSKYNSLVGNKISNNWRGLEFSVSSGNEIYHNNFIDNFGYQIFIYNSYNSYNQSYSAGGNYWSDYTGQDLKSGTNQDQFGSDGIGDIPYTFQGLFCIFQDCWWLTLQDRYPFMKESGWELPANQPPTISDLGQFKSDGIISIEEGGITTESSPDNPYNSLIIFKATLNDPDNDQVKLQVEIKEYGQEFNEQDLLESDFVSSGATVSLTRFGLVQGVYKWRTRAVDEKGNASDWQEFGVLGNVDFEVKLVPLYTQRYSPYPSESETLIWSRLQYGTGNYKECFDDELKYSAIRNCGCAITSEVMLLRFHDVTTDINNNDVNPGTFNEWLANPDNNGYWPNGGVKWEKIQEYSKDESGFARVIYDGPIKFKDNFTLDLYLDNLKPVILYEKVLVQGVSTSHFIVADGKLATTYTVKDSAWYETRHLTQATAPYTQNYNNYFYGLRLFSPALALRGVDSISLNLASPAELLVTDPQGRKLGKDPINNIEYNEIPDGSYYQEGIGNPFAETPTPTKESKNIWIPDPLDGEYNIRVIGTDSGTYTLDFLAYNEAGESTSATFEGVTDAEVTSNYSVNYTSIPGEITEIERVVTIEDAIEDVKISYELGWITKKFVKDILIAKLKVTQILEEQKERQLERFDKLIEEAKNPIAKQKLEKAKEKYEKRMNEVITRILELFIKEVRFYTNKGYITEKATEFLIKDAQYIIEHL